MRTVPPADAAGAADVGVMMTVLPFLLLLFPGSMAEPVARPLSVRQVIGNAEALDGQEIEVTGWIEYCHRRSCPLFDSKAEARDGPSEYWISIGPSRWFDTFAARKAPGPVTLRAKFDARCVSDPASGIIAVCADRANSLQPRALAR